MPSTEWPHLVLRVAVAAALQVAWATALAEDVPPILERPGLPELETPQFLPQEEPQEFELPPVEEPLPSSQATAGESLDVKGFAFEGNKAVATPALQGVVAAFAGRKVSRTELEELRQSLSRYYIDRGYINSGALLADDFYRDGIVHFRIVEGKVEEVRARGLGRLHPSYLRDRLVHGDEPLNVNVLQERFQLLLTDPLFAKINTRLEPGAAPGLAILDVEATRARPWELSLYYNNYQPPSIGSEAVGLAGLVRNLTGSGDTLDATCQQGTDKNGRCGLGWTLPIAYRTDFHARYDHGESSVLEEPIDAIDVDSILDSYELGIRHALVDTIKQRLSLGVLYTHRENSTSLLGVPFSFVPGETTGTSKVDAWRFEQDYVRRWEKQAFALRSTFTWGWTNTNPDLGPPDVVPAKDYFFWLGQAQFTRRVLENGASVLLRGTFQWTPDHLVPLEQIALGGVNSVRGYRENQLVRDQSYSVSLEFHYPLFERPGDRHRFFLIPFVDFGEGWNRGQEHEQLSSVGLGINWEFRGLSAELYYGKRLVEPDVETSGNLQDEGIHFQVRYQF